MTNKYKLEIRESNEIKEFKSLKEITVYTGQEYHRIRSLYMHTKKPKKFLHPIIEKLYAKYRILDIED